MLPPGTSISTSRQRRRKTHPSAYHLNRAAYSFSFVDAIGVSKTALRSASIAVCLVLAGFVIAPQTVHAQTPGSSGGRGGGNAPLKGLVWEEPAGLQHAVRELMFFAESGVEAVRVDVLRDTMLYAVGDSLGIQFFQELPFRRSPASGLLDSLESALIILDKTLLASAGHRSARHFGLASFSDTSVKGACHFFETLSARVGQRIPDAKSYYVTHFVEDDACGLTVDFVLLDRYATDRVALSPDEDRFANGRARGYGVAELGRRVDAREEIGLSQPYSAESQARYFESALPVLLKPRAGIGSMVAVFVYQWGSDFTSDIRSENGYSMSLESGEKRLAWAVVRGIYTGSQTVFAFPFGSKQSNEMPWLPFMGLLIAAAVATSYAVSPQFRQLVPRYFLSHGFYREAAAQGRDVTPVVNGVLLACVSLSVGITSAVVFYTVRDTQVVQTVLHWLPDALSQALLRAADRPWMLALLAACGAGLGTVVWISILSVGSRLGRTLVPMQTLMIVLWPQWLILVLLPIAMVVPTFSTTVGIILVNIISVLAGLLFLWILVRILLDYGAASRAPLWMIILAGVANPVVLISGFAFLFLLPRFEYVKFLMHLVTRN